MSKEILDFKICKRLYEAGVIVKDTIYYNSDWELIDSYDKVTKTTYPALTIIDWLEVMKGFISVLFFDIDVHRWCLSLEINPRYCEWTLKESVEQALTFLLDNWHIWKS